MDDVSELTATLAHEFGHYEGGDTCLGGVVYRTRIAIGSVLDSLGDGWLSKPFVLYAKLYLRVTSALSRHQELEADRASVLLAGRDAHISGLEKEMRAGLLFGAFIAGELAPLVQAGVRPGSIYDSFRQFVRATETRGAHAHVDAALAKSETSSYDTHPSLPERVAFAHTVRGPKLARDCRPAWSLLRRAVAVEEQIEPYVFNALGASGALKRVGWDDVAERVYAPRMAEEARTTAKRLQPLLRTGTTFREAAAALAAAIPSRNRSPLVSALDPSLADVPSDHVRELSSLVLGRALGVLTAAALIERGGRWTTSLGEPLTVVVEGELYDPFKCADEATVNGHEFGRFVTMFGLDRASDS